MEQGTGKANLTALGRRVTAFEKLETFPAPKGLHAVACISEEMTAVCPVTGQPDWYKVQINYNPAKLCVESKTLKLYLQKYRNEGMFCEDLASRIAHDLHTALHCTVEVVLTQTPRGGIEITAVARKDASDDYQGGNDR